MIKNYSYDQEEIINNILILHNQSQNIELDPCYNLGGFYKNGLVKSPRIKSDIAPQSPGVLKFDIRSLPFENSSIKSAIFDPPFIIGRTSLMSKRYGSFNSLSELLLFYKESLHELKRVLKHGGLLIIKCQDFVNARKMHFILPQVLKMAKELNFATRDLFHLLAKSRAIAGRIKNQQHARNYHCYFLVLKNNKRSKKNGL